MIFATYATRESEIGNVGILAASLRAFGGAKSKSPVHIYVTESVAHEDSVVWHDLADLGIERKIVGGIEDAAAWYHYAGKVTAAARAEADAVESGEILAWLDEDTVFLQEPVEFDLPARVSLGYRPAMHRNIAPLWNTPLNAFWERIYNLLAVPVEAAWPMVTPADEETVYPWINAGCLVVRPERGLLRMWAETWPVLYRDPELKKMCEADLKQRIFLHQAALTCAIINHLKPEERLELSPRINYPLFFKEMFGGEHAFDDLTDVTTFRHESYFRDPAPDWTERLKGPAERIDWIGKYIAPEL
jgi:hypothetical protein